MIKSYPIQHDFFFTDVDLNERGYSGCIKDNYSGEFGPVILFSDILDLKSENQFEKIAFNVPLSLFQPILVLDVWPNEDEGIITEYAKILLKLSLERLNQHGIKPLIALNNK